MKVVVTQENLSAALQSVGRVAGRNSSLPILANVLIKTNNNRLLISATNLELAISEFVGAKVETEGEITVPARLIADFIQNLPAGTVELSVDGSSLKVETENYSSTIHGISASDFPSIPDIKGQPTVVVSGHDLKQAINEVMLAASSDETRPVLTGVLVKTSKSTLTLAATDSYRLAEKTLHKLNPSQETQVIMPAKSMAELVRLITGNEDVSLFIDEGQIKCVVGEAELISRLIDGNYPAYGELIPSDNQTSFEIDTAELLRITKVASLFARDSAGSVTLTTNEEDQKITLSAVASQVGDNTSSAEIRNGKGNEQITFNARYLIDALQVFPDESVVFGFSGRLAPCVLRGVGSKKDYVHIIMPLRS